MPEKLKLCPWCGRAPDLKHFYESCTGRTRHWISCSSEYDMCPIHPSTPSFWDESNAIKAWDTRSDHKTSIRDYLKPCPYCGHRGADIFSGACAIYLKCWQCESCVSGETLEAAFAAWNARTDQPAASGKKVYRAGDVVPDGWYWCKGNWVHAQVVRVIGSKMFITGSKEWHNIDFPLISIDPPEGVGE